MGNEAHLAKGVLHGRNHEVLRACNSNTEVNSESIRTYKVLR